jgi:plastocyanin
LLSLTATRHRFDPRFGCWFRRLAVVLWLALATLVPASSQGAPPNVTVSFVWSPHDPLVGQLVTFVSTSTASGNNTILSQLWDLNGDGKFGDQVGSTASTSFATPGGHVVRLRVVDRHGDLHQHVLAATVAVQPLANQAPSASFAFYPSLPGPGQTVTFYSTATDPDSAIAVQRWDLDGNGSYGDAVGPTATRSFAAPGTYTIGLQVADTAGGVSVALRNLSVEPSGAASLGGGLRPIFPFPLIRLSGTIKRTGIRVRRLVVDAPTGSGTEIRCKGRKCPFHSRSYGQRSAVASQRTYVRRLEGVFLRAGSKLQIFVTRPGAIGRYTRFWIRGSRPPVRLDRCLVSVSTHPVRCASG